MSPGCNRAPPTAAVMDAVILPVLLQQVLVPPCCYCRQTSLTLQNVAITNCSSAAIVLVGPGASLHATNVTFRGHASSSSTSTSTTTTGAYGLVIAAQDADITLQRVTITDNTATRPAAAQTAASWGYSQQFYPACRDSSRTGGVSISPPQSSSTDVFSVQPPVCGSPILNSSLIYLQDSNLTAWETSIAGNIADAIISATGSSQQSLQLLEGTQVHSNSAAWLLVADSWPADAVGRSNMMAPQPSRNTWLLDMQPPYTTGAVMNGIRDRIMNKPANAARPLPEAFVGAAPKGQVGRVAWVACMCAVWVFASGASCCSGPCPCVAQQLFLELVAHLGTVAAWESASNSCNSEVAVWIP